METNGHKTVVRDIVETGDFQASQKLTDRVLRTTIHDLILRLAESYVKQPSVSVEPMGATKVVALNRRPRRTRRQLRSALKKATYIVQAQHLDWTDKQVARAARSLVRRYVVQ